MEQSYPPQQSYPLTFSVDYPDRPLSRLTTFFRVFTVIPIAIVLATVSGGSAAARSTTTASTSRPGASSSCRRC